MLPCASWVVRHPHHMRSAAAEGAHVLHVCMQTHTGAALLPSARSMPWLGWGCCQALPLPDATHMTGLPGHCLAALLKGRHAAAQQVLKLQDATSAHVGIALLQLAPEPCSPLTCWLSVAPHVVQRSTLSHMHVRKLHLPADAAAHLLTWPPTRAIACLPVLATTCQWSPLPAGMCGR